MKFAILIYSDVEPIDVGATTGVLSMARRFHPDIDILSVAEHAGEVVLASNVRTIADYDYSNCPEFDILIVTGGPGWKEQCQNENTLNFIRAAKDNSVIVSVCTGGMILAASGIVSGLEVTTRRLAAPGETAPIEMINDYAATVKPVVAALVDSGNIITGGGVTLAIDMMFYLLERFCSSDISQKTAKLMEYDRALSVNSEFLGINKSVTK